MGNKAKELGVLAVKNITRRGTTFVGGVPGLALVVHGSGTRSWILRYKIGGVRRDMGLGSFDDVSLANAREAARAARAKIVAGSDPIQQRKAARSALVAEMATALTFSECATKYMEAHESGWRNPKHAQQWRNTIESYANPVIGQMLVRDVGLTLSRMGSVRPSGIGRPRKRITRMRWRRWHWPTPSATRWRPRIGEATCWRSAGK